VLEDALKSFAETVGIGAPSGAKPRLATRRIKWSTER